MAHNDQCNLCGAFDDSTTRAVNPCEYCSTPVCSLCFGKHNTFCKDLTAAKRRNQGPTVANTPVPQHRRGHEVPPTTGPDRPNWNPKVSKDVQETTQDGDIVWTNMGPAVAPDGAALAAVKDLQKEE